MNIPILKVHWERFKTHIELDRASATHLLSPYTANPIEELILLSEGCANTNYKITFKNDSRPLVLRIYVREKSALQRELALHRFLAGKIPVPRYLYTDDSCASYPYAYALVEWMEGTPMRKIILNAADEKIIAECAFDAGKHLGTLRRLSLPLGGFFQENLTIRPFSPDEEYLPYVLKLLEDPIIQKSLGQELHHATVKLVETQASILPQENEVNLTHADYDPANILVKETAGTWKISAILDWEFAYAGTYLLDIGLMLRYAHQLPACHESSFIQGIEMNSGPLPLHWKKQAKLMDLLCLLQLAHYNPPLERPKLNADVVSLIANTIQTWDKMQCS